GGHGRSVTRRLNPPCPRAPSELRGHGGSRAMPNFRDLGRLCPPYVASADKYVFSLLGLIGLVMYPFTPAACARASSSVLLRPETPITGVRPALPPSA